MTLHFLLLSILYALLPRGAVADESSYCRKVRARAGEDAALLMWPKVFAEGDRFPSGTNQGPTLSSGLQPRIGLIFSPTDLYRGVKVEQVADEDCELHGVKVALQEWVSTAASNATLPALEAQVAYLDAHQSEWQESLSLERERREAGYTTLVELENLRRIVGVLERKLESQRSEQRRLEAQVREVSRTASRATKDNALVEEVGIRSRAVESGASSLLGLGAFQVRMLGGVIPTLDKTDWYARVDLTFDLGSFAFAKERARYRMASDDEMRHASYELPARAALVEEGLRLQKTNARRELKVVESELAAINATRTALQGSRTVVASCELANLAAERMLLESDQVFLSTLIGTHP
jgi:hypothetical protein